MPYSCYNYSPPRLQLINKCRGISENIPCRNSDTSDCDTRHPRRNNIQHEPLLPQLHPNQATPEATGPIKCYTVPPQPVAHEPACHPSQFLNIARSTVESEPYRKEYCITFRPCIQTLKKKAPLCVTCLGRRIRALGNISPPVEAAGEQMIIAISIA